MTAIFSNSNWENEKWQSKTKQKRKYKSRTADLQLYSTKFWFWATSLFKLPNFMFDTWSFLKCFPLFAAYLLDHFFLVYHERREGSPPPPPDFERMLFNHNAYNPGGTLPKYISGTILISVTRKCAHVIPIGLVSSRFSIWWPRKTTRPRGASHNS